MWKWLVSLVLPPRPGADLVPRPAPRPEARPAVRVSGRFAPFHKYLNDRYADVVVLTFDEIEDIAGFALPEGARLDLAWWTATEAGAGVAPYSDAWRSADRTARANMAARTVTFERR